MKVSWPSGIAIALSLCSTVTVTPHGIGAEVIASDRHLVKYDTGVVYDPRSGLEWFAGPDRGMASQMNVNQQTTTGTQGHMGHSRSINR